MIEKIQDAIIEAKLTYLNGYLQALALVNSYSPIDMDYKLFCINFSDSSLLNSIQNNSIELFDKSPFHYNLKLEQVKDWKKVLLNEFIANFDNRASFINRNELTSKLIDSITFAYKHFIDILEKEFLGEQYQAHILHIDTNEFYRILGLDLVFEVENNKVIFLKLWGSD